jgi:hypothetical protein
MLSLLSGGELRAVGAEKDYRPKAIRIHRCRQRQNLKQEAILDGFVDILAQDKKQQIVRFFLCFIEAGVPGDGATVRDDTFWPFLRRG